MTYKEKLHELSTIAVEKAKRFDEIEKEFNYDGFHKYSANDYIAAHDGHADAVNNHGALIKKILDRGHSINDKYIE